MRTRERLRGAGLTTDGVVLREVRGDDIFMHCGRLTHECGQGRTFRDTVGRQARSETADPDEATEGLWHTERG